MNFYEHDVEAIVEKIDSKKARSEMSDKKVYQHKNKWPLLTMYTDSKKKEEGQPSIPHANKQLFKKLTSKATSSQRKEPTLNALGMEKGEHKSRSLDEKFMSVKLQAEQQPPTMPKQPVSNSLQQVFSRIAKTSKVASVSMQKKPSEGSLFSRLKLGSKR